MSSPPVHNIKWQHNSIFLVFSKSTPHPLVFWAFHQKKCSKLRLTGKGHCRDKKSPKHTKAIDYNYLNPLQAGRQMRLSKVLKWAEIGKKITAYCYFSSTKHAVQWIEQNAVMLVEMNRYRINSSPFGSAMLRDAIIPVVLLPMPFKDNDQTKRKGGK